jgi:hypothetical protein
MARVVLDDVLDDVLDSWEADSPPDGFAARVVDLAAQRGHGLRNAELRAAHLCAEACLEAWEAQGLPEGFADRVMRLAAERHEGLRMAEPSLDAWEGERPPQGFAERVVSLAEERQKACTRSRARWAMVPVAAMAAIVVGLLVSRLPMPWNQAGQLASTPVPFAPQPPSAPAAPMQVAPVPREAAPPTEAPPRLSPALNDAADRTARRPLKQPLPIARPAPVVARRTPELRPEPIEREAPAPHRVTNPPGSDTKEASFDLVAYKRARASALHREKRFNKTEGSGLGFGGSYRLAP